MTCRTMKQKKEIVEKLKTTTTTKIDSCLISMFFFISKSIIFLLDCRCWKSYHESTTLDSWWFKCLLFEEEKND